MFLDFPLYLQRRWASCARYFHVFGLLIQDAKGWCFEGPFFLGQRYDLKHIGVSDSDIYGMRQSDWRPLVLGDKWYDLDDILVQH